MLRPILIITGASRSIGAATARLAATRGYAAVVNFLFQREAAELVVETITQAGGDALAVQANIADEEDVCRLVDTVDRGRPSVGDAGGVGEQRRHSRTADAFKSLYRSASTNARSASLSANARVVGTGNDRAEDQ